MTAHKHAEWIKLWADGEALEYRVIDLANRWIPVPESIVWNYTSKCDFRLAKPRLRYRVALVREGESYWVLMRETDEGADKLMNHPFFVRWLTDWTEYEA